LQPLKHVLPISSTDDGTEIDRRDEQSLNAAGRIARSLDSGSKRTVDITLHPLKQSTPMISTDDGMQMDFRDEQFSKV
jgi:hypothetical protein